MMTYLPQAFRITAIGRHASLTLCDNFRGEVGAVFERSFYVVTQDRWVCLVPCNGGMGPLNARCDPASLDLQIRDFIRVGDRVIVADKTIYVGNTISFAFDQAETWAPASPIGWDARSVARGIDGLSHFLLLRSLPREGLAVLLEQPTRSYALLSAVAAAAQEPLRSLTQVFTAAISTNDEQCIDVQALVPLLGLGPGLTPSGDDAIGGAMIALHVLGYNRIRDSMWSKLAPIAASATGRISYAHLEAAAEGFGHEALHNIINALLMGQTAHLDEKIKAINAIGHTSGWDALVGAVTVLTTWLHVQRDSGQD